MVGFTRWRHEKTGTQNTTDFRHVITVYNDPPPPLTNIELQFFLLNK